VVSVSGAYSYGVVMIAEGNTTAWNSNSLFVRYGARIIASGNAAGAVFMGGTDPTNGIIVSGSGSLIDGSQSAGKIAVGSFATVPSQIHVSIFNGGAVKGSVVGGDGSTVANGAGSTLEPGPLMNLGAHGVLTNNGTLNVGGAGKMATTAMTGTFIQGATGVMVVDANNATGQADLINVQGSANIAGTVQLNSVELTNRPVTVLTATDGVTLDPSFQNDPDYLFTANTSVVGNTLQVQPQAHFIELANGLSSTDRQLAYHLQQIWNSGSSLNGGFSAMSAIGDSHGFASALNSIAGAAVRGVAATRHAASDRFFDNLVSCQALRPGATPFQEDNCGWMRVIGSHTGLASMNGDPGYQQTATTYQIGGQYEFSPGWFVGGSLGYEASSLSGSAANVSGQSGLAGIMIKHQTGPWLLTGELDGGFGSFHSTRQINVGSQIGTATGSPDVGHIGMHVQAAYQMDLSGVAYLQPSLTLGVLDTTMSRYAESGTTSFNLNVHGSNNVTASLSPMIELGTVRAIDSTHLFRAFADIGMAAYSNSDWAGAANLELAPAGTGTFTVDSKLPGVVGKLKAGVDVQAGGGLQVKLVYSADVASGFLSQAVTARLAYQF
jgi:uncharacterized protein with beta-barrel porin domain